MTQCDQSCTVKDFKTFATEKQNKISNFQKNATASNRTNFYLEDLLLSVRYGHSDVAITLLIKLLSILKINIMVSYI